MEQPSGSLYDLVPYICGPVAWSSLENPKSGRKSYFDSFVCFETTFSPVLPGAAVI